MSQRQTDAPAAIDCPIVEVTLFEDRARVLRRGEVTVGPGTRTVQVDGVAPVLSDQSLTATVEPHDAGVEVVEARVSRRVLTESETSDASEALAALRDERDVLDRRLADLEAQLGRARHEAESLHEVAVLTLHELAEEAACAREDVEGWNRRLDEIREAERPVNKRLVDVSREIEETHRDRERLARRLATLDRPSLREWAGIDITLAARSKAAVTLRIEYVVPGACWRPYHTARLAEGAPSRLSFETDGCVWQNTGEDWNDVALRFSTQRLSEGTGPPRLTTDLLEVRKRPEALVVEARDQEITSAGLGMARREGSRLPGVDDGGTSLNLLASRGCDVPSDGRPHRVPLGRFQTECEVERVAFPELEEAVVIKTLQPNGGAFPVLAGPVDLVREGGYAGRASVLFAAPGERFALGFGPEADLRVAREPEQVTKEAKLIGTWEHRHHRVSVRLANLGREPRTVVVTERVPVSEVEKVEIHPDPKETTRGVLPDDDGFVRWTLTLPPDGHETLHLRYTLKKHPDVKGI